MGFGSGIRDPEKTYLFRIPDPGPGVKKAPDPGSRILNTDVLASGHKTGVLASGHKTGVFASGHKVTRTNASIEVWVMFPEPASHGVLIWGGAV